MSIPLGGGFLNREVLKKGCDTAIDKVDTKKSKEVANSHVDKSAAYSKGIISSGIDSTEKKVKPLAKKAAHQTVDTCSDVSKKASSWWNSN